MKEYKTVELCMENNANHINSDVSFLFFLISLNFSAMHWVHVTVEVKTIYKLTELNLLVASLILSVVKISPSGHHEKQTLIHFFLFQKAERKKQVSIIFQNLLRY